MLSTRSVIKFAGSAAEIDGPTPQNVSIDGQTSTYSMDCNTNTQNAEIATHFHLKIEDTIETVNRLLQSLYGELLQKCRSANEDQVYHSA